MSRRGSNSVAKNQMDLAIALSKSLKESEAITLSKLAEELPASVIEDDDVPQNIVQMQKEFLERLQPKRAGPSKKGKQQKKSSTVVPTLLTRCPEDRLRILTEKVALVLLMESPKSTTDDIIDNSIPVGELVI